MLLDLAYCKVQAVLLLHLLQNPREYGQDRKKDVYISFRIADFEILDLQINRNNSIIKRNDCY